MKFISGVAVGLAVAWVAVAICWKAVPSAQVQYLAAEDLTPQDCRAGCFCN